MTAALRVVRPGLMTTVQDLGRPHAIVSGVSPGGAMDRFAHSAANLLAGNDRGAATLECTLRGPRLVVARACIVAVTGADLDLRIDGAQAPLWTAIAMREGQELTLGARRAGARAYIAVGGGIVADRWLGSMSTNLLVGRGGMHGRPLVEGDVIEVDEQRDPAPEGRTLPERLRPGYTDHTLHAVPGPQADRAIFGPTFQVSPDSNRMGYRLAGHTLDTNAAEILSFAVIAGAVQLPRGGRPILLMADHQTAGGYPVVAVVVSASMPVAAQLAPGDELVFVETSIEEALEMRVVQREALESLTSWSM